MVPEFIQKTRQVIGVTLWRAEQGGDTHTLRQNAPYRGGAMVLTDIEYEGLIT